MSVEVTIVYPDANQGWLFQYPKKFLENLSAPSGPA